MLGAHRSVSSVDANELKALAGQFDVLPVTTGASLAWDDLIGTLAPKGWLHMVGVVTEEMKVLSRGLLSWQPSISVSPTAVPVVLSQMMEFCVRHGIAPQIEHFAMNDVNAAIDHLRAGKARYRVVLKAERLLKAALHRSCTAALQSHFNIR